MKKLKVFEGFAGYGGASFALKRMKESYSDFDYDIIGYSEIDLHASELYDANHKDSKGKSIKNWGDISKLILKTCLILICLLGASLANLFLRLECKKGLRIPMDEERCLAILSVSAK